MSDYNELALVTGAAQRLGREIALGLASQGYAIGMHHFHSTSEADALERELRQMGIPALSLKADLLDSDQIKEMFLQVKHSPFTLKVLVNSAAVMPRQDLLTENLKDWDDTLSLNLRAPWLCSREAAQLMMGEGGVIINIGDSGAHKTWLGYPTYILSKAALETLTRLLARRLAPQIRVNCVAPGLILPGLEQNVSDWQSLVNRIPLQQPGTVDDIIQAVEFIIKNEYITGQTLVVDGGYQLI